MSIEGRMTLDRDPDEIVTSIRHLNFANVGKPVFLARTFDSSEVRDVWIARHIVSDTALGTFIVDKSALMELKEALVEIAVLTIQNNPLKRIPNELPGWDISAWKLANSASSIVFANEEIIIFWSDSLITSIGVSCINGTADLTSSGIIGAKNVDESMPGGTFVGSAGVCLEPNDRPDIVSSCEKKTCPTKASKFGKGKALEDFKNFVLTTQFEITQKGGTGLLAFNCRSYNKLIFFIFKKRRVEHPPYDGYCLTHHYHHGPCSSWVRLSLSPLSTDARLRPAGLPLKGMCRLMHRLSLHASAM